MPTLAVLVALLVIHAWWAPTSWLGRSLNGLIESASRRLASIRLGTIIGSVAFVAALGALVAYGKFDGLVMAALGAPEGLAMLLAFDVGTAIEVLVISWLATARGGLSKAADLLGSARRLVGRLVRARPAGRRRRSPRGPANSNDDDPAAPWLQRSAALAA